MTEQPKLRLPNPGEIVYVSIWQEGDMKIVAARILRVRVTRAVRESFCDLYLQLHNDESLDWWPIERVRFTRGEAELAWPPIELPPWPEDE